MSTRITAALLAGLLAASGPALAQAPAGDAPRSPEQERAEVRRAEAAKGARERLRRVQDSARQRRSLRQGQEVTESVSRTARIGRDGSLDLRNIAGRVVVTGVNGDEVRIDAVKRVWHQNAEQARALLQELDVEIIESPARVGVRTRYPRQQSYDAEVDYTVSVPQNARVTLRAVSGDVVVSNVRGELTAEAVSGSVTASGVGDVRLLRSVSGAGVGRRRRRRRADGDVDWRSHHRPPSQGTHDGFALDRRRRARERQRGRPRGRAGAERRHRVRRPDLAQRPLRHPVAHGPRGGGAGWVGGLRGGSGNQEW